jgi:hypothetical protein
MIWHWMAGICWKIKISQSMEPNLKRRSDRTNKTTVQFIRVVYEIITEALNQKRDFENFPFSGRKIFRVALNALIPIVARIHQ